MFEKILVAVDGSDLSMDAVRKAAALAEKFGGAVTVLNVVVTPAQSSMVDPTLVVIPNQLIAALEEEGQRVLERAQQEIPAGVTVSLQQKIGHPAQTIIEVAKSGGFDLIILGSRGLGEIKGYLLGSISDRVSHHAPCAVMIVH